jgi:hypothetical protein
MSFEDRRCRSDQLSKPSHVKPGSSVTVCGSTLTLTRIFPADGRNSTQALFLMRLNEIYNRSTDFLHIVVPSVIKTREASSKRSASGRRVRPMYLYCVGLPCGTGLASWKKLLNNVRTLATANPKHFGKIN